jgi:hypothetical protein
LEKKKNDVIQFVRLEYDEKPNRLTAK